MRGWKALSVAAAVLGLLLLPRCFSPALPDCSYRCFGSEPACPDEYECRDDGYCHRQGTATTCPFSDMRQQDLRRPADLSSAGDGGDGGTDDAGADAATD